MDKEGDIMLKVKAYTLNILALLALAIPALAGNTLDTTRLATDHLGRVTLAEVMTDASGTDLLRIRVLDVDGAVLGTVVLVGTGEVSVAGIAVDVDGRILVAGTYSGHLIVGDQMLVSAGLTDAFVLVLDVDAAPVALRGIGSAGVDRLMNVGLDVYGDFRIDGLTREATTVFTVTLDTDGEAVALEANGAALTMDGDISATYQGTERSGSDEQTDPDGINGAGGGTPGTGGGSLVSETENDMTLRVIEAFVITPGLETLDLRVERR